MAGDDREEEARIWTSKGLRRDHFGATATSDMAQQHGLHGVVDARPAIRVDFVSDGA